MTQALVFTIIILSGACAVLWTMLHAAARDIDQLEDFIVELDDGIEPEAHLFLMPLGLRAELAEEAADIRDSRKEEGDE